MEVQSLMESIVILAFVFDTMAVVALIIAVGRINRILDNMSAPLLDACKATGVSYKGYWRGAKPWMVRGVWKTSLDSHGGDSG